MNFAGIGIPGLVLILLIVLVLFGPQRLPELGRAVGRTLKEFKTSARGAADADEDAAETRKDADRKSE